METNFKVDVPSFALGFNTGRKKGGDKTVIDVPELPTENIEEGKIYRVQSEVQETVTEIWVVLSEEQASMMGVPSVVENGEMWRTLAGMQGGFSVNYFCHIVDELPKVGELSMVVDQNTKTMTINMYVLKGDSESRAYCYAVNGGVGEWSEYDEFGSYRGTVTVNDVSELENLRLEGEGYYIVNRPVTEIGYIYGIPDEANNKTLYEHSGSEWVECKAGPELNIAYGDTPPEDTTKLWVKTAEPNGVLISPEVEQTEIDGVSLFALPKPLPAKLSYAGCEAVGSKIYIIGGITESGTSTVVSKSVIIYDTETKKYEVLEGVLGVGVTNIECTVVGTRIYFVGGGASVGGTSNLIRYFDTETNEMVTCSSQMPTAAIGFACIAIDDIIYIFGGQSGGTNLKTVYKFNTINDSLDVVCDAYGFHNGCCVAVGTTIFFSGGGDLPSYLFDTTTEVMTKAPDNIRAAMGSRSAVIDGKIIALGGRESKGISVIDLENMTRNGTGLYFPDYFGWGEVASIGNKVYAFGGSNGGVSKNSPMNLAYVFSTATPVPAIPTDSIYVKPSTEDNIVPIVKVGDMLVEIGVDAVYKGNAEGIGEPVEAALYNGNEWETI